MKAYKTTILIFTLALTLALNGPVKAVSQIADKPDNAPAISLVGNYVSDEVKIRTQLPTATTLNVQFIDLTGKVVRNFDSVAHSGEEVQTYSVGNLPRGIYIVRMQTGDTAIISRVSLN